MVGKRGRARWWWVGCAGLLGVIVLAVAVVGGLTWHSSRSADPQERVLVYEDASSSIDGPTAVEDPDVAPDFPTGPPATVLLEIDSGELIIEPAAPGEVLSVQASYNANAYRLEESLEGQNPWSYRMRFLVTGSRLLNGIRQGIQGGQPQLRVRLPLGVPLELTLVQRNGGAIVDLSGLHLLKADFDVEGVLLKVDADAPLEGTLERFTMHGGSGGLVLESMNLMGPETIDIDFRMGQVLLDARGVWAGDTAIELTSSLVDITLRLPRDATIEGLETTRRPLPNDPEIPRPKLVFVMEPGRRSKLRVYE